MQLYILYIEAIKLLVWKKGIKKLFYESKIAKIYFSFYFSFNFKDKPLEKNK